MKKIKIVLGHINNDTFFYKQYICDMKISHFDSIDSTNTYSKNLVQESLKNGTFSTLETTLVTANTQTAGRGRLGRSFYSPAQTGIYMSLIYKHQNQKMTPAMYTSTAAVAVSRILDRFFNIQTQIKWVNDIYLGGKKICGILAEGVLGTDNDGIKAIVVGIGINISTKDFPDQLNQKAGSIMELQEKTNCASPDITNQKLAEEIAEECIKIFSSTEQVSLALQEYRNRSCVIGKTVTVHPIIDNAATDYSATVTGITDDAKLIVQLPDGTNKMLDSGEISIKM